MEQSTEKQKKRLFDLATEAVASLDLVFFDAIMAKIREIDRQEAVDSQKEPIVIESAPKPEISDKVFLYNQVLLTIKSGNLALYDFLMAEIKKIDEEEAANLQRDQQ